MSVCKYMVDGKCVSRLALPHYGSRPSPGVCGQCKYRDGVRGLGDIVALAISYTPFRSMQGKCGACESRQETLNAIAPTRRCGCSSRDGLDARTSAVDTRMEIHDGTDL